MAEKYDVIIIGAGIGGLTAGAILARNGKKVLILEKNPVVGGYTVNYKRRGFTFESSLHLVNGGGDGPVQAILEKCGIGSKIEFLKPEFLFHSIFPDFDIKIPHCDLGELIETLNSHFPSEKQNIGRLMKSIGEVALEVKQLRGSIIDDKESTSLPFQYKASSYYLDKTWGNIIDSFLEDERLKAVLSQLWPFFGLPPAKLSAYYFSASLFDYLLNGGYYIRGGSGALAITLSETIKANNGTVLLNAKADEIMLRNKEAVGVKIVSGEVFSGDAIISNIDAINTFSRLLPQNILPAQFLSDLKRKTHSISAFEVHLGLNIDLSKQDSFVSEYELFWNPNYDLDRQYLAALANDMEEAPIAVTFYSNLERTFAPPGKSYVSITALAGYDYWKQCPEKDYKERKEKLADILIKKAQNIIPSLSNNIEVKDIATPLTVERYTDNYKGAIYGWEQSAVQSGINRTNNSTPISNLYLAGAWTRPGAGVAGVMQSGERVAEYIMRKK